MGHRGPTAFEALMRATDADPFNLRRLSVT